MKIDIEGVVKIGADDDKGAVGEVKVFGGAKDERKGKGNEGVDGTGDKGIDDELGQHRVSF